MVNKGYQVDKSVSLYAQDLNAGKLQANNSTTKEIKHNYASCEERNKQASRCMHNLSYL